MDREVAQVPYFAYEGEMMRSEQQIRRLLTVIVMLIILTVVTNILWVWYVTHYDCIGHEQDQSSVSDSEQDKGAGYV